MRSMETTSTHRHRPLSIWLFACLYLVCLGCLAGCDTSKSANPSAVVAETPTYSVTQTPAPTPLPRPTISRPSFDATDQALMNTLPTPPVYPDISQEKAQAERSLALYHIAVSTVLAQYD